MVHTTTKLKKLQIKDKRCLIYVDASLLNGRYKIGLYDKTKGIT